MTPYAPIEGYELRASGWFKLEDGSGPYALTEDGAAVLMGGFTPDTAGMMSLYRIATNGERFPDDSQTSYTYDGSGVNITSITKTTPDGVSYKQTWTRDGMAQLSLKSGWVRQP